MTTIAQRRVAGATALMILLYLLQVALFAPAAAASGETCPDGTDGWTKIENTDPDPSGDFGSITWSNRSAEGPGEKLEVVVAEGYQIEICIKQGSDPLVYQTFQFTTEDAVQLARDGDLSHFAYRWTEIQSGKVTVDKVVVINSGTPTTTSFDFTITDKSGFSLTGAATPVTHTYDLTNIDTKNVTITEGAIQEAGWTTSVVCDDDGPSSGLSSVQVTLVDGSDIICTFTNTYNAPLKSGKVTVDKVVVINSGTPTTTSFDFTITDKSGFSLTGAATPVTYTYDLTSVNTKAVTITEGTIAEAGWTTTVACDDTPSSTGSSSVQVTLADTSDITCTFTNTYNAQTTTTQATTTTSTTLATTTTEAEVEAEVLGTTITTTVAEVSADTLPFTGSESGDMVKLAMLAMAAGALMLFAVRGSKEEEEIATEIGGWSSL